MISVQEIIDIEKLFNKAKNIKHELISQSSNSIYKINADGINYILRIDGEQKDYLGLDRTLEVSAMKQAADIGLSPAIYSSDDERYIVMEYISGGYINREQMLEREYIIKMVDAMKKAHQITGIERECSPFYMLERYIAGIKSFNVTIPDGFVDLLKNLPAIEKRYSQNQTYATKYCHNDFFTFNMITQNDRIVVIDWELSGMSSIFFDLSTLSFSAMYNEERDRFMLESYFGNYENEYKIKIGEKKI
jgi:thiamine kinase-like enzyme